MHFVTLLEDYNAYPQSSNSFQTISYAIIRVNYVKGSQGNLVLYLDLVQKILDTKHWILNTDSRTKKWNYEKYWFKNN